MSDKDKKPTPPRTTTNGTSYEIRGTSHVPKTGDKPTPTERK